MINRPPDPVANVFRAIMSVSAAFTAPADRTNEFPYDLQSVVLPIDKPKGITSFDVIRHLRRRLKIKKIGHAGTLDPMATGLLICLIGRSTKRMNEFLEYRKCYTGTIRFGQTTPSFDAETEIDSERDIAHLSIEDIRTSSESFAGTILQQTPMYSAVRVGGERLYHKARRGEKVITPQRFVTIYDFSIDDFSAPDATFTLICSSGTYVRSIANELGQLVNTGAHLVALRREYIGPVSVDSAWTLEEIPNRDR
jgi:tRNA pseudouridine55 synthase